MPFSVYSSSHTHWTRPLHSAQVCPQGRLFSHSHCLSYEKLLPYHLQLLAQCQLALGSTVRSAALANCDSILFGGPNQGRALLPSDNIIVRDLASSVGSRRPLGQSLASACAERSCLRVALCSCDLMLNSVFGLFSSVIFLLCFRKIKTIF